MNASDRSTWADDTRDISLEATCPGDVLALSGERAANDDDVFPVDDFVEDGWEDDERSASFSVTGRPPWVLRMQREDAVLTQTQGMIKRVQEDRLVLGTPGSSTGEVSLGYRLPASLDLRPLLGRRVRLTLEEHRSPEGRTSQTLTVRTQDHHTWLVARCGSELDAPHVIGGAAVRVGLSPSDGGPLVVATPELQHIVAPGGEARVGIGASRYVVELVSRDGAGRATYFIADDRLWH